METAVAFFVFGRIEVRHDGQSVDVGGRMQRAVLSMLLAQANQVVSSEWMIDQLWNGAPPASADTALHVYIANLRRALEPGRAPRTPPRMLLTQPPGYVLRVEAAAFDVARFEALVREGGALLTADRFAPAQEAFTEALAIGRGTPYAELALEPWLVAEVARLGHVRVTAEESLAEARLALGEASSAIGDLEKLVAADPLRERAWELLALALYRCGRQAEALRAIARLRQTLGEELGLEPRPSVVKLEGDILRHAPELEGGRAPAGRRPDEDNYLEVWSDRGRQLVVLAGDSVTLGRASSSTVQVPEATVSRTHAVIEQIAGRWSIRDAGSANGTFVNGTRVSTGDRTLQPGDEIRIGDARLFFRSRSADAAAETVGVEQGARRQPDHDR